MKIALISFGHFDVSLVLAKYLTQRNIGIDLYMVTGDGQQSESVIDFRGLNLGKGLVSISATHKILEDRIQQYIDGKFECDIFNHYSGDIRNPRNIFLSQKFARVITQKGYDCIHFNGNSLLQLIIGLFTKNIPKVHTIHDYVGHSGERKLLAEVFNKYLVRNKSQKIFHSEWCAHLIDKKLYDKQEHTINVVPYSVLEVYRMWENTSASERENSVLFWGRISSYKGIEYLIGAAPLIKEAIPNVKIVIAGAGECLFEKDCLQYGDIFEIIHSYLTNAMLVKLIQESSIVVCPYVDATQSGVVMTALAFNKPVVATKVGSIPEVITNGITGITVPPRNAQKLADAIIDLLKNSEKRKKLSKNIKEKFSQRECGWDSIAERTIAVYKKAINKSI